MDLDSINRAIKLYTICKNTSQDTYSNKKASVKSLLLKHVLMPTVFGAGGIALGRGLPKGDSAPVQQSSNSTPQPAARPVPVQQNMAPQQPARHARLTRSAQAPTAQAVANQAAAAQQDYRSGRDQYGNFRVYSADSPELARYRKILKRSGFGKTGDRWHLAPRNNITDQYELPNGLTPDQLRYALDRGVVYDGTFEPSNWTRFPLTTRDARRNRVQRRAVANAQNRAVSAAPSYRSGRDQYGGFRVYSANSPELARYREILKRSGFGKFGGNWQVMPHNNITDQYELPNGLTPDQLRSALDRGVVYDGTLEPTNWTRFPLAR